MSASNIRQSSWKRQRDKPEPFAYVHIPMLISFFNRCLSRHIESIRLLEFIGVLQSVEYNRQQVTETFKGLYSGLTDRCRWYVHQHCWVGLALGYEL